MRVLMCLMKQMCPKSSGLRKGFVGTVFGKYLFLTNTLSSGGLMAIGDFVQQQIEAYQKKHEKNEYDYRRTFNMGVVATAHGVFHHFFYGWMDRRLPVNSVRNSLIKILLDQVIASPACLWIFFIGMAIMEHRGVISGWEEMKKKFLFCYMVDWIVWPPNQFINFYYVPQQYRVVYINALTMLYDVFLSYIKFFDQK